MRRSATNPKGDAANTLAREHLERQTARIIQAMAWNREAFKNRVEEHLGGALLEFYKAQLAEKNGQTKWVRHWRSEVRVASIWPRPTSSRSLHATDACTRRQARTSSTTASAYSPTAYRTT
ncbi:MAG: hypothetical protein HYV07_00105 [Deltaproteobacteria bacterium]|nr:hypothetical protein [Deltaproteobacteria bacterium]